MMRSMLCLLIFVAGSSLARGSACPIATANSTAADINIVWVCEQLNYRTALAEWKEQVEENCNSTEAEEYWQDIFTCPDFSALSCLNDAALLNESDSFNCSLTVCSDGLYTDQTAFVDIWRDILDYHNTTVSIYASKLVHCDCEGATFTAPSSCGEYDTTQLEVCNNVNLKYSEILMADSTVTNQLKQLENKSEAWDELNEKYSELSNGLNETSQLIAKLENQTEVLTAREQNLTDELEASKQRIVALKFKVEFCVFKYDGKCFRVEFDYDKMNYAQAKQRCTDHGAKLANIYSKEHYYRLTGYLRTLIAEVSFINAWLGMNFVSSTLSVTLSDGTPAPFVKWWSPTAPNSAICCRMLLRVTLNLADQDLHSSRDNFWMRAAVCEL